MDGFNIFTLYTTLVHPRNLDIQNNRSLVFQAHLAFISRMLQLYCKSELSA